MAAAVSMVSDAFPEDIIFKVFALLDAPELARVEVTCTGWLVLLHERDDLWRGCLDYYFFGRKRSPKGSKRKQQLKEMCAYRAALPSRSISCGDGDVAIDGCSAVLRRPYLGSHRSVVADRPLSSTLPMCWPRGEQGYDLAHYAYFEVEVGFSSKKGRDGLASPVVTVGLATPGFRADTRLPGCDRNSIAMDGTNGLILYNDSPVDRGVAFGPGDVVGCGIAVCHDDNDNRSRGIFFVKNGKLVQPRGYAIFKALPKNEDMYPVVGLDSHSPIRMHFDSYPSGFDVFKIQPEIRAFRRRRDANPTLRQNKLSVVPPSWKPPLTACEEPDHYCCCCSMGG